MHSGKVVDYANETAQNGWNSMTLDKEEKLREMFTYYRVLRG
jgi:hypothetical protein